MKSHRFHHAVLKIQTFNRGVSAQQSRNRNNQALVILRPDVPPNILKTLWVARTKLTFGTCFASDEEQEIATVFIMEEHAMN